MSEPVIIGVLGTIAVLLLVSLRNMYKPTNNFCLRCGRKTGGSDYCRYHEPDV
jgi:hypothetical protein